MGRQNINFTHFIFDKMFCHFYIEKFNIDKFCDVKKLSRVYSTLLTAFGRIRIIIYLLIEITCSTDLPRVTCYSDIILNQQQTEANIQKSYISFYISMTL